MKNRNVVKHILVRTQIDITMKLKSALLGDVYLNRKWLLTDTVNRRLDVDTTDGQVLLYPQEHTYTWHKAFNCVRLLFSDVCKILHVREQKDWL